MTTAPFTPTTSLDDRTALAIRQQIEILESHARREGEWSASFLREHALMIVQMAESLSGHHGGFGSSHAMLL